MVSAQSVVFHFLFLAFWRPVSLPNHNAVSSPYTKCDLIGAHCMRFSMSVLFLSIFKWLSQNLKRSEFPVWVYGHFCLEIFLVSRMLPLSHARVCFISSAMWIFLFVWSFQSLKIRFIIYYLYCTISDLYSQIMAEIRSVSITEDGDVEGNRKKW